jgi:capsular exopolysaccharide synthesis family protein
VAQLNDSTHLAAENGDGNHVTGALVPRDHDLNGYTAIGAPMYAPVWQDQAASGMSITKMLHSFRRRWLLALFMGLLLGIPAALATWLIFPKQYEVQAMLQFHNMEQLRDDAGYGTLEAEKEWRETQLHLIRSQLLLTATLREPKVSNLSLIRREDEPINFLQKSISVFSPKDSDLVFIRMVGEDAREMVEIVKTLTTKYVTHAETAVGEERTRKITRLENTLKKNSDELSKLNQQKILLQQQSGARDSNAVTAQRQHFQDKHNQLRQELVKVKDRLWTAQNDVDLQQARNKLLDEEEYPEALLMAEIRNDPQLYDLRQRIADAEDMYNAAQSAAKNANDPAVIRAKRRLASYLQDEQELKSELMHAARIKLLWGPDGGQEKLMVAQNQVGKLEDQQASLETEIAATEESLKGLSNDSAELLNVETEIKLLQDSNGKTNAQLDRAYQDVGLPVAVIEEADMPEGSTLMYRVILTSFLGILCFCVGVGGVVLLEYTKQRVSTLNDIGYGGLGIRVLGTVPNLARLSRQVASKNGEAAGAVSGILAESIDSVRTMLLSNKRADAPKVILVTSADEHEGKTTVASHLAASLARAGRRTLLVDGDLRKPAIHQLFDMPLSAGVCEVLRGEAEIDAVVHPAQVEGMWVMLAGQCDQQAIASLAKESAAALFRTLRADYEFVVIDSGPALAFADTMLMGSHADAAVMAILRDVSQIPKVYEARERLEAIGMQVLGGVVGGVATNGSRSYALLN